MTKMVMVPADVLTATVRYLVQRPYVEVAQLIPALMAAKEVPSDEHRNGACDAPVPTEAGA